MINHSILRARNGQSYDILRARNDQSYGILRAWNDQSYGILRARNDQSYGILRARNDQSYGILWARNDQSYGILRAGNDQSYGILRARNDQSYDREWSTAEINKQKTELKTHFKIPLLYSFVLEFWFIVFFSQDGTDSEVEWQWQRETHISGWSSRRHTYHTTGDIGWNSQGQGHAVPQEHCEGWRTAAVFRICLHFQENVWKKWKVPLSRYNCATWNLWQ